MKSKPPVPPQPEKPVCDRDAPCDECGTFGAYALDGVTLCLACYTARGSCCAEAEERPRPHDDT